MKVAVGSQNPIKIEATRRAFVKAFEECEVEGVSVSSGVSDMPIGLEEIAKGATSRAKAALEKSGADFGVGLEGGFEKTKLGTFMINVVAIIDKKGKLGISRGGGILMPSMVIKNVSEGKELGMVMDEIVGANNTKQHDGAAGYFTKNIIDRTQNLENSVVMALARFFRPESYEK